MATIATLMVRLGVDVEKMRRGMDRGVAIIASGVQRMSRIGKVAGLAVLAGQAIQFTAALAPAVGIMAAVPAVAMAGAAALLSLKLALSGVGAILGTAVAGDTKKFTESLKKLPPAARVVVAQLGGALFGLQRRAQQSFFKPMAAQSAGLAARLRGPLQGGIASVAGALGRVGARVLRVARESRSLAFLQKLFTAVRRGIDATAVGIGPLLRGIRDFAASTLGGFTRAGGALGRLIAQFGRWLSQAGRSGRAMGWIHSAVTVLRRLGQIVFNIGTALYAMFNAADISGGGLLNTLVQLTARFAAWAQSAQGQQQVGRVFALLGQTAHDLSAILPSLASVLGLVADLITSLPAPIHGAVSQFLAWSIVIGLVSSRIGPLLSGIKLLGGGALGLGRALINPESRLRRFASTATGATTGAGRAMSRMASAAARGASRMASAIGSAAGRGGASVGRLASRAATAASGFASAAGRIAASAGRAAAAVVVSAARMTAAAAAAALRVVAGWITMAVQSLLQAARMALAWLIAMGPVGLIIAAVVALVALIIANWDTIRNATVAVWNAIWGFISGIVSSVVGFIRDHWRLIISIIGGPLGLAVALVTKYWTQIVGFARAAVRAVLSAVGWLAALPGRVAGWFSRMAAAAVSRASSLVSWMAGLPGRILRAVGNLDRLLYGAGRSVVIGLWNGIVGMGRWLYSRIIGWIRAVVPGPVLRFLGIASPSRLFAGIGMNVAQGLAAGISRGEGLVARAAGGLSGAAVAGTALPTVRAAAAAPAGPHTTRVYVDGRELFEVIQRRGRDSTARNHGRNPFATQVGGT